MLPSMEEDSLVHTDKNVCFISKVFGYINNTVRKGRKEKRGKEEGEKVRKRIV